jgi:outer membrane receptor for ferrienterochelin and colicins
MTGFFRMRYLLLCLFFSLSAVLPLAAQLNILVTDKSTGKPVEGVALFINLENGRTIAQSITDAQGQATVSTTEFPITVSTSHVSYNGEILTIKESGSVRIDLETSLLRLDEVVVTGQFEPQSAHQSVYRVRTISSDRIQAVGSTRLQDVLNTELNIRFSQDLALGGSNLSMQGLSGQNVKVLIDGVPMIGRQGTANEININQINVASIDRIEIVEGPMSVVYGADALAGVINIITKKPDDGRWSGSVRLHEESVGDEYGVGQGIHNQSVSLGYARKSFYGSMDFTRNDFDGWQGSAEGRDKEWHPKLQYLSSAVVGFKKETLDIYYRLDYLNETVYNPGTFSSIEAIDQRYFTNRFMHQVQANARIAERLTYTGALAYSSFSRRIQTTTVNRNTGDERLALGPGMQDLTEFKGLTFRGTFHYKLSEQLSLQPGYDINYESGTGGRLAAGVSSIGDYAVFVSAEYKHSHWLSLRPGIRVVYNTVYEAPPAIPSINAKVKLNDRHDIRASYGRGFRAPSIRELFFNFFDASHSIEGNPDLKAELSHSFNLSWNGKILTTDKLALTTVATAFYNDVNNMIGFGVKPSNTNVTTYLNIAEFTSKGITLSSTLRYAAVEASLGMGITGRTNQLSETGVTNSDILWSPEVNGSVTYRVEALQSSVSFYYKYTGKTPFYSFDVDGSLLLNETEGFHWGDISMQKSIRKHFSLSLGVRNLFNVTRVNNLAANGGPIHGGGTSQPIGYGRSYFLSMTYTL